MLLTDNKKRKRDYILQIIIPMIIFIIFLTCIYYLTHTKKTSTINLFSSSSGVPRSYIFH